MLFSHLPTAFPWYDKIEKQTRFKAGNEFNYPELISPDDAILPFQFRRPTTGRLPTFWGLYDLDGTLITDLSQYINSLQTQTLDGYDYFWMLRNTPMVIGNVTTLEMDPGCYYCVMQFNTGLNAYSEVFHVPVDHFSIIEPANCNYPKLEWRNFSDVAPIHYDEAKMFMNRVYLDTRITASEPIIEEEIERDGDNTPIPTFQRAVIKYRVSAFAADFLKLALSLLPMHEEVGLTTANALEAGKIVNIVIEPTVLDGGIMSSVEILFEQEIVITNKLCADNMTPAACPSMPPSIDFNFLSGSRRFIANIPANMLADIELAPGSGPVYLYTTFASNLDNLDLSGSGWPGPAPGIYTKARLKIKTFNCTVGTTAAIDIT